MTRAIGLTSVILLSAAAAIAQPPTTTTTQPAGQKVGLATSLQRGYGGIKNNLTRRGRQTERRRLRIQAKLDG